MPESHAESAADGLWRTMKNLWKCSDGVCCENPPCDVAVSTSTVLREMTIDGNDRRDHNPRAPSPWLEKTKRVA